jgi:rhodanese-related sulfurtransferase
MKLLSTVVFIVISLSLSAQPTDTVQFTSVGPEDFLTLIRFEEKAVIIDVRMPFEFRKERIENSVNIPMSKTEKRISDVAGIESVILLYCTTDYRSIRIASRYYDLGYRKIYSLEGGIEAWKRKGLPVIKKRRAQSAGLSD